MMTRAEALERLENERFDLLVIGGGIVGAGTAALAARHGLTVALLERSDFGSGTSSASSKLIHGGLRYLRMGDVGLVRQALHEARALGRVVAPHLVWPTEFVLPIYRDGPYGKTAIRTALALYSGLTGTLAGRGRVVDARTACDRIPALRARGLRAAGLYADAQTDDARLCLLNVRAAADDGAVVVSRAEVVGLLSAGGRTAGAEVYDRLEGRTQEVRARAVVNAAGPWVDRIRRLEDPQAGTSVTLSKGVHVVAEPIGEWSASLTIPLDRNRVSFAVPWRGMLLLGTTDAPFDLEPDELVVTDADERQILQEASLGIEGVTPDGVRHRFAGLRVLPTSTGTTASVRRELTLSRGPGGMLTVAGGKLTTFRLIAISVLDALRVDLGLHRLDREPRPLPGAVPPDIAASALRRRHAELEADQALHLARTYGSLAGEVVAAARRLPDGLEPLSADAPELVAQVAYAAEHEWALDADDVLRRRTTLAFRGLDTPELRTRIGSLLGLPEMRALTEP